MSFSFCFLLKRQQLCLCWRISKFPSALRGRSHSAAVAPCQPALRARPSAEIQVSASVNVGSFGNPQGMLQLHNGEECVACRDGSITDQRTGSPFTSSFLYSRPRHANIYFFFTAHIKFRNIQHMLLKKNNNTNS